MKYFLLYYRFLLSVLLLLPLIGQAQTPAQPTASLVCTQGQITLRVGCTYRFNIVLNRSANDNCWQASYYQWHLPASGYLFTTTRGGTTSDDFIEFRVNAVTYMNPSYPFTCDMDLNCAGPSGGSGRATASTNISAANVAVSATAYGPQVLQCQGSSFQLGLSSATYVSSCVWQQKVAGSATWTDIQNGYTGNAANNFAYTVTNFSSSCTYRAKLTGCDANTTSYSSELPVNLVDYAHAGGTAVGEQDVLVGTNQGSVALVGNIGTFSYWQSSQDNGSNWVTVSQATAELKFENLTVTTQYRAVCTLCNGNYFSVPCTVRVHAPTQDISWTEAKSFDSSGATLLGDSRTYFDQAAKPLQSQAKSLSQGKILVAQPLYGTYSQVVGTTLPAPIAAGDFAYTPTFVTPSSAPTAAYDYTRFDGASTLNSPETVSTNTAYTLGWYYSTNNPLEPYTAVTAYPYSRSDAVADGSTGVSRAAGAAPTLQLGSGRETVRGVFPVRTELNTYAAIRQALFATAAVGAQPTTLQQAAVQSLSTDADGNTALAFADKEGHPVMSARPATNADAWLRVNNTVEVGWPYSAKITYLGSALRFTATADLMLYNTQGACVAVGSPESLNQTLAAPSQNANGQEYTFYCTDPFSVDNGTVAVNAQWREAYAYANFYIVGDGSVSITNQPYTPTTEYEILNTVTGTLVTGSATSPLAPGCYQVRIKKGAISLTYSNRFKDISFAFYNQKGQVVENITPLGVKQLLQDYQSGIANLSPTFATTYEYDQQGRQTAITETDAGRTEFFYRTDGKLRFSQNAKQLATGYFSYINYDNIGRPIETGENTGGGSTFANCKATSSVLEYIPPYGTYDAGGMGCQTRRDVIRTYYDQPTTQYSLPANYATAFLAGRVAATVKASLYIPCATFQEVAHTLFSYDEQGRTQWQLQQTSGQPTRTIDYTYDAAGNVSTVCYQKGTAVERLTHYYTYDADNRLILVQTDRLEPANSTAATRTQHARYFYYLHGPLKRVTYGGDLQGLDYTYTAAGQLKAINNGILSSDPGQDGAAITYPDFWGTTLHYYENDYASAAVPSGKVTLTSGSNYQQHYNGLLSGMSWQTTGSPYHAYGYNYDYKGQLLKAAYGLLTPTGTRQYTFAPDNGNRYSENLPSTATAPAYDPNGNMSRLQRTDGTGNAMPVLDGGYEYFANTNKLKQVNVGGAAAVSYTYDEIGEAVSQQELDPTKTKYLEYDGSGKVTALYADNSHNQPIARYTYDEFGKRLTQRVYPNPVNSATYTTTSFVRDAAGHELASYVVETVNSVAAPALLYEQPIYGATRLGIYRQARGQSPAEQLYELNDQLGNTRIVFRRPTTSTYTLSMEDNYASQEQQDFPNPTPSTYANVRTSAYYLTSSPYNDPSAGTHYSMGLLNRQGPAKTIAAGRGDKFHVTAYAFYVQSSVPPGPVLDGALPSPTSKVGVPGLAGLQVNPTMRIDQGLEQPRPPLTGWQKTLSQLSLGLRVPLLLKSGELNRATGSSASFGQTPPPDARLQCIIRKASDNSILRVEQIAMSPDAGVDWQPLQLDFTITAQEDAVTVEISAQNNSGNTYAYFDDLVVKYDAGPIVEENHYYAYGQRLDGLSWRRGDERLYGRGYQGQHTTQDVESGYTAFDLRMYDARYARWLMTDPKMQYASSYNSLGNNPVSNIDADGGETTDWYDKKGASRPIWFNSTGEIAGYQHIGSTFTGGWDSTIGAALSGDASGNYSYWTPTVEINGAGAYTDLWRSGYYSVSNGGQAVTAFAGEFIATAGVGEILGSIKFLQIIGRTRLLGQTTGRGFYSGSNVARSAAIDFAARTGGITIDSTPLGRMLAAPGNVVRAMRTPGVAPTLATGPPSSITGRMMTGLWRFASKAYAEGAEGAVPAHIDFPVRPDALWLDEVKALEWNGNPIIYQPVP